MSSVKSDSGVGRVKVIVGWGELGCGGVKRTYITLRQLRDR